MDQYVPDVSEEDIARIVARDFVPDVHAAIHEMIREVEVREKTRVVLASLKNSKGNVERLKGDLANASGYYREIISEAEYPNYTKKWFHIDKLSQQEKERIIEKDKAQYLQWLRGPGAKHEQR